jgi:hypothetical protein
VLAITRQVPLAYFTDGGDVILIASNYGGNSDADVTKMTMPLTCNYKWS